MKHHVKTTARISEEFYQHSSQTPKFGEGQGKASSPSNWLFLNSTLLAALHVLCTGISLTSICTKYKIKWTAESYVDDTDVTTMDGHGISPSSPQQ
eukprot:8914755-Ditylum_brightwellii.AAC.1